MAKQDSCWSRDLGDPGQAVGRCRTPRQKAVDVASLWLLESSGAPWPDQNQNQNLKAGISHHSKDRVKVAFQASLCCRKPHDNIGR